MQLVEHAFTDGRTLTDCSNIIDSQSRAPQHFKRSTDLINVIIMHMRSDYHDVT
jgi:hypothetical protein